jgi:hypothetical protein
MNPSILKHTIQKHPQVCATFLDGELVVMGNHDKIYYRINASGIHIWNFLESRQCSVQTIVEFIADYYGLEQSQVLLDVELFILSMLEKKIVQYVGVF